MPRITAIIATVAVGVLVIPGLTAASTTTPIVPNDVGHWLNLEYRAGTLAPEIAESPALALSIVVIDRSLSKIDAVVVERNDRAGCIDLLLPYRRHTREVVTTPGEDGGVTETIRPVEVREELAVRVCSTFDRRSVLWMVDGALYIVSRALTNLGTFPRTYYSIYQVTADELATTTRRNARLEARGKSPKPPQFRSLYQPPGTDQLKREKESLLAFFGAEFSLPPTMAETLAEEPSRARPTVQTPKSNR